MSVSRVDASRSAWPVQAPARRTAPSNIDTAERVDFSRTQLGPDPRSADTLNDLASGRGRSSSQLISSTASDVKANAPVGGPAPVIREPSQIAPEIAAGPPAAAVGDRHGAGATVTPAAGVGEDQAAVAHGAPAAGREGRAGAQSQAGAESQAAIFLGGPTSDRAQSNLSSLAETLGTDPSTLLAHLSTGQDLSSLPSAGADGGYGASIVNSSAGGIIVDQYA